MDIQIKQNNEELNQLLQLGKAMEGFEKFYAQNVVMQENESEPRLGKDLNREACGAFVDTHPDLKLEVLNTGYGQHISFQEVLFSYIDKKRQVIQYSEVAVRHWKNGQVIKEKFYYAS